MPMPVKPGYVNPLTMMKSKKTGMKPAGNTQQENKENKENNNVKDLVAKQQGIKNQILLMKSTTSVESVGTEALEQKLEEITTELKAAKSQEVQMADTQQIKQRFDTYESSEEKAKSLNLYEMQLEKDKHTALIWDSFRN